MKSVSVVIPSQRRPESLLRCLESVLSTVDGVEVVVALDEDDVESRGLLGALEGNLKVVLLEGDEWTTAERWNEAARHATGDYFVTGADDVVFQPGWLEAAFRAMNSLGGDGVVGFNEGPGSSFGQLATHFMVSRKYAVRRLGGTIMIPVYQHGWTDAEVTLRAKRDGRLAFAEDARINHLHPFYGTADMDEIYEKGQSTNDADEALFNERLKTGFRDNFSPVVRYDTKPGWGSVAIGLRSYKYPEPEFFDSWTRFIMGGLRPGDRMLEVPRGKMAHIAANKLASDMLLMTDCDSLLLIDDDMILPFDALSQLRDNIENWDYDIVQGFCTFKTYPPHAVAYELSETQAEWSPSGLTYNALAHFPENGVVEVDAVGMAFTLIKRHVFEEMLSEKGAEYTIWFDFGGHSEMEDMRFSRRCREYEFTMCVDTHAKIGHIGRHVYGWPEHQQFVKLLEKLDG